MQRDSSTSLGHPCACFLHLFRFLSGQKQPDSVHYLALNALLLQHLAGGRDLQTIDGPVLQLLRLGLYELLELNMSP